MNCGGNWITGSVARVWRMWRVTALILRKFGVQEHDTYTAIIGSVFVEFFMYKYILFYLYTV